ncbi:MAG TPA: HAMP domain-containing sensor histidine kinase [Verrucomicrobiae bacterium]|nr:HAMP domain-containing sensor histidine kinase [Verrucomicrobiae bacterium]
MPKSSDDSFFPRTEVWQGEQEIFKKGQEELASVKIRYDSIVDRNGPSIMFSNDEIIKAYADIINRGLRIRLTTEISANNISYCKKLSKLLDLRHFDGIKGNLGIVDGMRYGASARSEEKKFPTEYIYSTVKSFVEQQQYFFDMLWNKSIPAEIRIKEIEEGIKPNILETITDPFEIKNVYLNLIKSATNEIMLIIPTVNSMRCHIDIGMFQIIKDITNNYIKINENKKVRILVSEINNYALVTEQQLENMQNTLLTFSLSTPLIELRRMETDATTKSIIAIIDKKESLAIEIKDDAKNSFCDSVGFATYSNSRPTVLSYVSIFESFWKQSDLVKKLKESEELQKDFVHIAAHELKNPIQPIISSSAILKSKIKDKESIEVLEIMDRNAKKLLQLTGDILDVTKIGTKNLDLNMELFKLNDIIFDIVKDYNDQLENENIKFEVKFLDCQSNDNMENLEESSDKKEKIPPFYILADKIRITQVLSNLLNNAIKFTSAKGLIKIDVEKKDNEKKVYILIKDTGTGIDSSIISDLFSKFVTKSKGGTGLGLYISKKMLCCMIIFFVFY